MIPSAQRTLEIAVPSSHEGGAIKATRGVIKKFRMWRTCYIAPEIRELPYFSRVRGASVRQRNRAEE
jgi:hypothetical protein